MKKVELMDRIDELSDIVNILIGRIGLLETAVSSLEEELEDTREQLRISELNNDR